MGAFKFRQGRSINLGLVKNHEEPLTFTTLKVKEEKQKMNWLMATFHAIVKPITKVIQNYRRKV